MLKNKIIKKNYVYTLKKKVFVKKKIKKSVVLKNYSRKLFKPYFKVKKLKKLKNGKILKFFFTLKKIVGLKLNLKKLNILMIQY